MSDNEIKEIDKEIIKETLEVLRRYLSYSSEEDPYHTVEIKELAIAEKYLRC